MLKLYAYYLQGELNIYKAKCTKIFFQLLSYAETQAHKTLVIKSHCFRDWFEGLNPASRYQFVLHPAIPNQPRFKVILTVVQGNVYPWWDTSLLSSYNSIAKQRYF